MRHISDTFCHVLIVKPNQLSFLYDQEAHPKCFPLKVLRRLPCGLPAHNSDGFCSPPGSAMWEKKKNVMWIILPFEHVFWVLVGVFGGCCVSGMGLIISIHVTDPRQPRPKEHCLYELLVQNSFCPSALWPEVEMSLPQGLEFCVRAASPCPSCLASPWLLAASVSPGRSWVWGGASPWLLPLPETLSRAWLPGEHLFCRLSSPD